jgi:hypothetical protein
MVTLPYYPCDSLLLYIVPLVVLCLVVANGRRRVVGFTRMWAPFYLNGIKMIKT